MNKEQIQEAAEKYATKIWGATGTDFLLTRKAQRSIQDFIAGFEASTSPCRCRELREALEGNPYPENVFKPLTNEQLGYIRNALQKQYNISLDRLSAQIGREIYKGLREKLLIGSSTNQTNQP